MDELCLRAIKVESATAGHEPVLPSSTYLCLRPLPCDSDQHLHPLAPAAGVPAARRTPGSWLRTLVGSLTAQ